MFYFSYITIHKYSVGGVKCSCDVSIFLNFDIYAHEYGIIV